MFKKIAVGVAAVVLTFGIAAPASAATVTAPAKVSVSDGQMTTMSTGWICWFLGWC